MIYGDVVMITSDGILVHEKALQPLGIFDQSYCWAVWSANPNTFPEAEYKHPNLVISPIHPKSWPFLVSMEVALADKPGALEWLCKELKEKELSVLFLECTTTGFTHAVCNIIAESTHPNLESERSEKEALDRKHPYVRVLSQESSGVFKEFQELANRITAKMSLRAREIETHLKSFCGGEKSHFLHCWEIEKDKPNFSYNCGRVSELMSMESGLSEVRETQNNLSYINDHLPKTASAHYMQRLAYFAMYGGGVDVPFALRYEANSALLKLEKREVFNPEGIKIYHKSEKPFVLGRLPIPAICTFNDEDKYLRLKPITAKILKNELTKLSVEYHIEGETSPPAFASKGLLHLISESLVDNEINLLHVSNKSTREEYSRSAGVISFLADISKNDYDSVRSALLSVNHNKPPGLESISIRHPKVYEYPQRKLFVSFHFGNPREEDIKKIIEKVAEERGFQHALIETYVAPVTRTVLDHIGSCQAFLQLLLFKEGEDPKNVSFSWLDFEYGVASGLGMPTMRIVDTALVPYDWWKNRITTNQDQRIREFRSDDSEAGLTKSIRNAIEDLAQELLRRQQEME